MYKKDIIRQTNLKETCNSRLHSLHDGVSILTSEHMSFFGSWHFRPDKVVILTDRRGLILCHRPYPVSQRLEHGAWA
jgi:hypothetical protein